MSAPYNGKKVPTAWEAMVLNRPLMVVLLVLTVIAVGGGFYLAAHPGILFNFPSAPPLH